MERLLRALITTDCQCEPYCYTRCASCKGEDMFLDLMVEECRCEPYGDMCPPCTEKRTLRAAFARIRDIVQAAYKWRDASEGSDLLRALDRLEEDWKISW
jgi:hypothetical protein